MSSKKSTAMPTETEKTKPEPIKMEEVDDDFSFIVEYVQIFLIQRLFYPRVVPRSLSISSKITRIR